VGPKLHPLLTRNALEKGVDVWMEKPPAMRYREIETLIRCRGKRAVMVGFKKSFMPAAFKVREILAYPENAPLFSMLGLYPNHIPANGAEILEKGEMTDWLGNGCHPVSFMTSVGGPVKAVTTYRAKETGSTCMLEFENGALGTLVLARGARGVQSAEEYRIFCRGGMVSVLDTVRVSFQRGIPFEYGKTTSFAPSGMDHGLLSWEPQNIYATLENMPLFTQGFYNSMKTFCDCVLSGTPVLSEGSLEAALMIMKIYEAALVSQGDRVVISPEAK
jgi:predicted dehydrogenase